MVNVCDQQLGTPCTKGEPLHVVAHLKENVVFNSPIMLDGLLAWVVAAQHRLLPPQSGEPPRRIEIPIQRDEKRDVYLCSQGFLAQEASEVRYKNRRAPWVEFARLGSSKIRRVNISLAENKSYRVPYELRLGRAIEWWCLGDAERILELLSYVHYLGKHRGSGEGALDIHGTPWTVEPCKSWGRGFPVVQSGKPMRPLPIEYPGLRAPRTRFGNVRPPYYDHSTEEMIACP